MQRHGISRLPVEETADKRSRFKSYKIGYIHIDSCELRHSEGKLHMFLAIDRVSKFTYVEFHERVGSMIGAAFLRAAIEAFPYKIHTVLTDNGTAFADLPKNRSGPTAMWRGHPFDRACGELAIEHRLTKPYHPWTNGQAERMNRTIKDATLKAFHYDSLESLKAHVLAFVTAYNFAKHLKALRWRTPYQAICNAWTNDPSIFKLNPRHLMAGPHTGNGQVFRRRPWQGGFSALHFGHRRSPLAPCSACRDRRPNDVQQPRLVGNPESMPVTRPSTHKMPTNMMNDTLRQLSFVNHADKVTAAEHGGRV